MTDILLVHDLQSNPAIRRGILERAGWSVRSTSSAAECLAQLRAARPALLVLDVILEGATGFDLCRLVREQHAADALPIVLGCHIYQDDRHAQEAQDAGAQRYVALPIEPEALVALVAELGGSARGVRAA